MKRLLPLLSLMVLAWLARPLFSQPAQPAGDAEALKQKVLQASGAPAWPTVKRLQFTFNVEVDGEKKLEAKHDWNVETGIDTVTWNGKTVTVSTAGPPSDTKGEVTADQVDAFQRWTNDSYWLLAPLKIGDPGVNLTNLGPAEIEGQSYDRLQMTFGDVGLTPGDTYVLYIDDAGLVRLWDYSPSPDKTLRFTWSDYQQAGPLTLATEHKGVNDAAKGRRIYFTDVKVETDE